MALVGRVSASQSLGYTAQGLGLVQVLDIGDVPVPAGSAFSANSNAAVAARTGTLLTTSGKGCTGRTMLLRL